MNDDLKKYIRNVKDFPKPGIMFRDITTILKDPVAMQLTFEKLFEAAKELKIDKVVGIESRGFIFGALLAQKLNAGFVPVRKPGKLPGETLTETYELEYGKDSIQIHTDAISPGDKVLLHDDLLGTGGTARAAINLINKLGGKVVQASFIVELSFLNGREKIKETPIVCLVDYPTED
ncbi:MAG: adenine phosphoribosyltransferase [Ignavibacteriaceae bacterium]|nr:adenine phosphoribosyltransferase [Ignavibacteriaceae bacterium]